MKTGPGGTVRGKKREFASVRQKIASKAAALHLSGRKGGAKKDSPSGKKKKKLSRKKAILLAAGAAVLAAGAYFIVDLFSGEEQTAVTGEITYSSLSQEISGTGTTHPGGFGYILAAFQRGRCDRLVRRGGGYGGGGRPAFRAGRQRGLTSL